MQTRLCTTPSPSPSLSNQETAKLDVSAKSDHTTTHNRFVVTEKAKIQWSVTPFQSTLFPKEVKNVSDVSMSQELRQSQDSEFHAPSPISYFLQYIPPSLMDLAASCTNLYAMQEFMKPHNTKKKDNSSKEAEKPKKKPIPVTSKEITVAIGLHMIMGVLHLPRVRMYWELSLNIRIFIDSMPRDRFFFIRNHLHFVNKEEIPKDNKDKFFVIRPLLNSVLKRCRNLEREHIFAVDEQMVPFKGQHVYKMYLKDKPNPWGFKIFMLCGHSGICYDFFIYEGKNTKYFNDSEKYFGIGAATVFTLAQSIPKYSELYFDNFFSSFQLLEILYQMKIKGAGTVRIDRFRKPPFMNDKELRKLGGRGASQELCSQDGKLVMVKWIDNRSVHMVSNFCGTGKLMEVERYEDKKKVGMKKGKPKTNGTEETTNEPVITEPAKTGTEKSPLEVACPIRKKLKIECPEVIYRYNNGKLGVDKFDQLISYYRIFIRSKKWTLRMIFHLVDLSVTNSWFEYRRECTVNGVPTKKQLDLMNFKLTLAHQLINFASHSPAKRGRPPRSSSSSPQPFSTPSASPQRPVPPSIGKKSKLEKIQPDIPTDMQGHYPKYDDEKEATRCKLPGCTGKTHVLCERCQIHLCFVKERNCFKTHHEPRNC